MQAKTRKRGRPVTTDTADTMAAAAARLGCSLGELRRARSAGCDAFKNNRVNLAKLKKWLEENPATQDEMDEEALKKRKLLAQCKKLELDEAILRGEYMPNAEVIEIGVRRGAQTRAEFMALISEAPTWQGLDAATLQDKARAFVTSALERLSNTQRK